MVDYIEFAEKIKEKYPQYKDVDSLTLAQKMVEKYPQYNFAKHKGYGTAEHMEAIRKYGVSEVHRPSFLKKL